MVRVSDIGIIGGGAWGTALALAARRAGRSVKMWARESDVVDAINEAHENRRFLPGVALDPKIEATSDITAPAKAAIVLLVVPAQHLREICHAVATDLAPGTAAVICAKGVERESHKLMSEVARETLGDVPLAALSGPTFAREVAEGLPTAVTLAAENAKAGETIVAALGGRTFRPYLTDDLVGAQMGGAVKNVLAIAAGIAIGRGLGDNARAAIMTRGFAEMARLALAKGARLETLSGLSGLGDLVLTCTSEQSRNFSLGRALGEGETLDRIVAGRESVAEGVASAPAVTALGKTHKVEMPIAEAVTAILHEGADIDETIGGLLARPFKTESEHNLA